MNLNEVRAVFNEYSKEEVEKVIKESFEGYIPPTIPEWLLDHIKKQLEKK